MTLTMLDLGIFLFGLLVGLVLARLILVHHDRDSLDCGEILVNTTDPTKDVLKFALDVPVVELMNADRVTFQVSREDD